MKKTVRIILSIGLVALIGNAFAAASSNLENLAGRYTCSGYDRQDKVLSNTTLNIAFDAANSMEQDGYGAYTFRWVAPSNLVVKGLPADISATGSIASNGNSFALSFKNSSPDAPTDYGTAIGVITHTQDTQGVSDTVLRFFGYQPVYKGGDNSTWTCTKIASAH